MCLNGKLFASNISCALFQMCLMTGLEFMFEAGARLKFEEEFDSLSTLLVCVDLRSNWHNINRHVQLKNISYQSSLNHEYKSLDTCIL